MSVVLGVGGLAEQPVTSLMLSQASSPTNQRTGVDPTCVTKGVKVMWFRSAHLHIHEDANTVEAKCPHCSNRVHFRLLWNKAGLGLGIPVIGWFTDAAVITTHTHYHLGCPTCGYMERISADAARGLIAEGKTK
jgi:predicted RNA-binding Zn-ribbon protein involved in translation (DUF1610 family)